MDQLPGIHYDSAMRDAKCARVHRFVRYGMCNVRFNPRIDARYFIHAMLDTCDLGRFPLCSMAVMIHNLLKAIIIKVAVFLLYAISLK